MISFNLTCRHGHQFEGWFSSSSDFDNQKERGLLTCPMCNDDHISKGLMAPNVAAKSNTKTDLISQRSVMPTQHAQPQANTPQPPAEIPPEMIEAAAEVMAEMRKVQKSIEQTCDDVGDKFAEEARKIHYGETEARGIYGQTSLEEAEALHEEGIEITKMPWLPKEQ